MFGIGLAEAVLFFLFILILAGANYLPDIGRSLGDAKRESRRLQLAEDLDDADDDAEKEDTVT